MKRGVENCEIIKQGLHTVVEDQVFVQELGFIPIPVGNCRTWVCRAWV